jgi:hypothetical protein
MRIDDVVANVEIAVEILENEAGVDGLVSFSYFRNLLPP